jgi:ATP-dependent DNA helicase Rep
MEPKRIAAITFTNKAAAGDARTRQALMAAKAPNLLICTFHALGVRMLRQDGAALGLKPQFSILDSDDVTSILKDAAAPPMPPPRASGSGPSACGRTWA